MRADFEARFERKMEFILDTLASVSAKNDETATLVKKIAARQDESERRIKAMQFLMKVGMKQMAKTEIELAELRKYTDQRFMQVMEKFDRWLDARNGDNGNKNGKKRR